MPTGVDPVNEVMRTSGCVEQRLADDAAGAGEHVDDAVGDAGPRAVLGEHERGERGDLRGLEHDGVARGDGREHLPDRHLQRVVPRRDRPDDADRLAAQHRGVRAVVLGGGLALEVAGGAGVEGDVVDRAGHVELAGELDRLAGLRGLDLGVLLGALAHRGREGVQRGGALARGGARPVGVRGLRRGDGEVDVLRAGEVGRRDDRAVRGVDHVVGLARRPGAVAPGDVLVAVIRHRPLLQRERRIARSPATPRRNRRDPYTRHRVKQGIPWRKAHPATDCIGNVTCE